jgi:hypothetical protein
MATRTKIRPVNKSTAAVAADAAADRVRKAASKAALKAAKAGVASEQPASTQPAPVEPKVDHEAQDRANALATARADAEATGVTFEAMCADMGIDPATGAPAVVEKQQYCGPMVALKTARLSYVAAKNGILCNGDRLALVCGEHSREDTVAALIKALKLEGNPYRHLNPGQQSMNLRNKARHALKDGMLTMAEIEAAFKA